MTTTNEGNRMNLNKDQIPPRIELPNVIKHHAIPSTTVIATKSIQEAVERLAELKRQEATIQKLIKMERAIIEPYMGDALELLDMQGNELATWKWNKDSIVLDEDLLRENFPEEYALCLIKKDGNRSFKIKV